MEQSKGIKEVVAFFRERGKEPKVHHFETSTATAALAAEALKVSLGQVVKSVVVLADGTPFIILVPGDMNADLKTIKKLLRAKSMKVADPDTVLKVTGYPVGAVPPVAHLTRLKVYMDRTLLKYPLVYPSAGTLKDMLAIDPETLVKATFAEVIDAAKPK